MMRAAGLLAATALACSSPPDSLTTSDAMPPDAAVPAAGCDPVAAVQRCLAVDDFGCRWGQLFAAAGSPEALAARVDGDPAGTDALLRALFPALGDRTLVDGDLPVPAGVTFEHTGFAGYSVPLPVDWGADPYGNITWQLYFQSLRGFHGADPDVDAAVLISWVDGALFRPVPLKFTWSDGAMAMRVDHATSLVDDYLATHPVASRRLLLAAAQLIVTHLYALAHDGCYLPVHNHGISEDLAILGNVGRYPALVDGPAMWDHAGQRLLELQVRPTVTDDGVNVENTPAYHLYGVEQMTQAIGIYQAAGQAPPGELVAVRDSMIEPAVELLQPDRSYPLFGDSSDGSRADTLELLRDTIAAQQLGDGDALALLDFAVSRGQSGTPPPTRRVYELGGYAAFRDRWALDDPSAGTAVHAKFTRLSGRHYHADETSFELFADGQPLIVGPGLFTYVGDDPLYAYQRSPAAQNVLVIDGDATVASGTGDARSRVLAHGEGPGVVWVQGTHAHHEPLGVTGFARTIAFVEPDVVVIVDHVAAGGTHLYAQHFHVDPGLAPVVTAGPVAIAGGGGGPTLAILGTAAPALRDGWHFPDFQVAQPAVDVVIERTLGAGEHDLPVLLVVTPPGQEPRVPESLVYEEDGDRATVRWRLDGVDRAIDFPRR